MDEKCPAIAGCIYIIIDTIREKMNILMNKDHFIISTRIGYSKIQGGLFSYKNPTRSQTSKRGR